MDNIHVKILEAINSLSPKSFVSPIEVNKKVKLDEIEFADRLLSLRRLRYVTVKKDSSAPSKSLPNGICGVSITDDGLQVLQKGGHTSSPEVAIHFNIKNRLYLEHGPSSHWPHIGSPMFSAGSSHFLM